ncbi:MAG: hypothetical protein PHT03_03045 [Bacilli bacterium]|nr:hypothetical protein [Bacilli bacterium]
MIFIKSNAKKLILVIFTVLLALFFTACDKKPTENELKMHDALNSIALGDISTVKSTFVLPRNTTIKHELDITWSIECNDETAKLEQRGDKWYVVITPTPYEEDEQGDPINDWGYAVLRATVSIGKKSVYREWPIDIYPGDKKIAITTIKSEYQKDDLVELSDVLVVHRVAGQGFLIQDQSGVIYVYDRGETELEVGDMINITGKIGFYGDAIQILDSSVVVITSENPISYDDAVETTIAEILALDNLNQLNFNRLFKLEGYIRHSKSGAYDRYHLEAGKDKILLHYSGMSKETETAIGNLKDKYISLSAYTFARNDKKMTLMVLPDTIEEKSEPELSDEEKADLAISKIKPMYEGKTYLNDLELVKTAEHGVTITWTSNKPEVISNQGQFTMPAADTEVTLTAKVSVGTYNKNVNIIVTAKAVSLSTIKQVIDSVDTNNLEYVRINGVIIGIDGNNHYYIADETGVILVQLSADGLVLGNKIEIIGKAKVENRTNAYLRMIYDKYIIKKVDDEIHEDPLTYVDATVADFDFTITSDNIKTEVPNEEFYGKGLLFDAYVVVKNDKVYLADSLDEEAQTIFVVGHSTNIGSIKSLPGSKIKVKVVVYQYSVAGGWDLCFFGRTGDVELDNDLTDQQKITIALEEIAGIVKEGANIDGDLNFITTSQNTFIEGVKYVWTTDDLTTINAEGSFTAPADDKSVKITLKIYLSGDTTGEADHTVEINVTALADTVRIADIKTLSIGTKTEVTGLVTFVFESGFILTDRTGGIYVYGTESAAIVAVGDRALVKGEIASLNYDTVEIKFPEVTVLSSENPVDFSNPVITSIEDLLAWDKSSQDNFFKLIEIEGYVREIKSGSYTNYYLESYLGNMIAIHYFALDDVLTAKLVVKKDNYISLTTYTFAILNGNFSIIYLPDLVEGTTAPETPVDKKIELAKEEIDKIVKDGDVVFKSLDFIATTSRALIAGAVYEWSTDNAVIIASDGTFSAPEENTAVAITVKCYFNGDTQGDPDATWVINVTALSEEDLSPIYYTGFEKASKKSYAAETVSIDGIDWYLSEALVGTLDNDRKEGIWSIRTRAIGEIRMESGLVGVKKFSFKYANYKGCTAGLLSVQISKDGENWVTIMDPTAGTDVLTEKVLIIDYSNQALVSAGITVESNVRFRFLVTGTEGNDSRMNIDEINIY